MAGYFLLSRKCAFGPLGLVNGGDNLSHATNYIVIHNDLLPRSGTSKMACGVALITASAAWRWLQSDSTIHLIDIRSTPEFLFVGHPVGAVHVPYIDEPDWEPNPCFTTQVRDLLPVVADQKVKQEDLNCINLD